MKRINAPLDRRAFLLHVATLSAAAVAGCSGDSDHSPDTGGADTGGADADADANWQDTSSDTEPDAAFDVGEELIEELLGYADFARSCFAEDDLPFIAAVGLAYLVERAPSGQDAAVADALQPALDWLREQDDGACDPDAMIAHVRSEFAALDTVDVHGWTLSPTEAALAGIVGLAEG